MQPWDLWIDTGGTFTDCLARNPLHPSMLIRTKVLSSGALRASVLEQIDGRTIKLKRSWAGVDDLVSGFSFMAMGTGEADRPIKVERFDDRESLVVLDRSLSIELPLGTGVELRSTEPAPLLAARMATRTPAEGELPPINMRLATTRGTNALLERNGAEVALFTTNGFADLLLIGDQQRPDLFALNIRKPAPLHSHVVEVIERIAADGSVVQAIDADAVRAKAMTLRACRVKVAAVSLANSYRYPAHEQLVASILREVGFTHVSVASAISPMQGFLTRTQTAVADAYLSPIVGDYLHDVSCSLGVDSNDQGARQRLHAMTSAGGLVQAEHYRACESLLSGPAGGVHGVRAAAAASGFDSVIGFDMGGTSTDVCRIDHGRADLRFEHEVKGIKVALPSLAVETVAAGGGSICDVVDGQAQVGPHSAGANPGPACYGAGGPLTITDINLLLGRLDQTQFDIPISKVRASEQADRLWTLLATSKRAAVSREWFLEGLLQLANERMAAAIDRISVRQGYDPRDYALLAFGGAGGQHACDVADLLGIRTVLIPIDGSLLSAAGLGVASIERVVRRQVLRPLNALHDLHGLLAEMEREVCDAVRSETTESETIHLSRLLVSLRLIGQDSTLTIEMPPSKAIAASLADDLRQAFAELYQSTFGHAPPVSAKGIEVESISMIAATSQSAAGDVNATMPAGKPHDPHRHQDMYFDGRWEAVPVIHRSSLAVNQTLVGPALIVEAHTSTLVGRCWQARVDHAGAIVVSRNVDEVVDQSMARSSAVQAELLSYRLMAIADDMGQMLQRMAVSTNVKQRLDFSCAILDADGQLVVNAPHIPVHLGALGVCVRKVRETMVLEPGDVVVTNHPGFGGSHLPDITVITPVFQQGALIAFVANRCHHAEIGGTRPGSMPPNATTLAEEGVVIVPQYLIRRGESRFDAIEALLRESPYPSRSIGDNLADLRAAVAANQRGVTALGDLATKVGADVLRNQMEGIANRADRMVRERLSAMVPGDRRATEHLDDGSALAVSLNIGADGMVVDFAGSAAVHQGNLNATPAIVRSAVMYVLRLMLGEAGRSIPLNEGVLRSVEILVPPGILNPPFDDDPQRCPAVVGGNTESSQRVVDVLIKALELAACSQGTMNNVIFGNKRFGYYETVCGGSGAGLGFIGASAVHTHMTNTRITDVEVLEQRYPIRVERFAVRRGSGGVGRWNGGDGVIRDLRFLEPVSLSVLSQHRLSGPFGMKGGGSGQTGCQTIIHPDGTTRILAPIDACEVEFGDRLVLETPGGGGFGSELDP